MSSLEFLKSINNVPLEGKEWFYHIDLNSSQFKIEDLNVKKVSMRGKCKENVDTMRITTKIEYSYGNSYRSTCFKYSFGIENAFNDLFTIETTHRACKECSTLFQKEKEDTEVCKQCMFFVFLSKQKKNEKKICSICQEEVFRYELECGHSFHIGCLAGLEKKDAKCPNCRMGINGKMKTEIFKSRNDWYDVSDSDSDSDSDSENVYEFDS
jgi:hypothetical protein